MKKEINKEKVFVIGIEFGIQIEFDVGIEFVIQKGYRNWTQYGKKFNMEKELFDFENEFDIENEPITNL